MYIMLMLYIFSRARNVDGTIAYAVLLTHSRVVILSLVSKDNMLHVRVFLILV